MAEYIKRETAVRAVMAAKWVDGSELSVWSRRTNDDIQEKRQIIRRY